MSYIFKRLKKVYHIVNVANIYIIYVETEKFCHTLYR